MGRIQEQSLTEEEQNEIALRLKEGLEILSFPAEADPVAIVYAVSRFVDNWQAHRNYQFLRKRRREVDMEGLATLLGTVWCVQVLRVTDWKWTSLGYSLAIVSPKREYYVSSERFVLDMLYRVMGVKGYNENIVVPMFDRITSGNLPALPPSTYELLDWRTEF